MPDSVSTSASSTPYLEQIKVELTSTVLRLKARLGRPGPDEGLTRGYILDETPEEVLSKAKLYLGYTIVMHQGFPFISEGDTYCGFPVVIDRSDSRLIELCAEDVDAIYDDGGGAISSTTFTLFANTRW